jgi:hypothetical protein
VLDEQLVGGEASEAESEHVRLFNPKMIEQAHDVTSQIFKSHGPVDVCRTAVPLKFDGDYPVMLGQSGDHHSEAELDRGEAPVEQDERRAVSMLFEVEMDSVDVDEWHTK